MADSEVDSEERGARLALQTEFDQETIEYNKRLQKRRVEIGRLQQMIEKLRAGNDAMAPVYIAQYALDIRRIQEAMKRDTPPSLEALKDKQDEEMAREVRRQKPKAGKKPVQPQKYPWRLEDDLGAFEMVEASGDEESASDEEAESQAGEYPYDYDAQDRPSQGGKTPMDVLTSNTTPQQLAKDLPSRGGKRPETSEQPLSEEDEEDEGDEEEEGEEEEEEKKEEASWEEEERRLNHRLNGSKNALEDFAAATNQTVRNAEASHGKAKRLVEMLDNGAAASDDVKVLAREMLEATALTLVEAYSAEEAEERAADNLRRASDRLRQGTFPYERRADIFNGEILRTQELIEKIKEANAM